jgi:hypothetical protein
MCISACPFGVIDINPVSNTAQKCTLCYDRLQAGMEPACSQACPTDSIQFGTIAELRERARARVADLHAPARRDAYLYGADPNGPLGGLNAFFLLVDEPEVYGLPREPKMPSLHLLKGMLASGFTASSWGGAVLGFRKDRMDVSSTSRHPTSPGPDPGTWSQPSRGLPRGAGKGTRTMRGPTGTHRRIPATTNAGPIDRRDRRTTATERRARSGLQDHLPTAVLLAGEHPVGVPHLGQG